MSVRLLTALILIPAVYATSQSIGDMAPLENGNLWVYDYDFHSITSGNGPLLETTMYDSSRIQMQMTGSAASGDTVLYYFRNSISGIATVKKLILPEGGLPYSPEPEVTHYSSVRFDTLYEIDGNIMPRQSWSIGPVPGTGPVPVCSKHVFDTSSLPMPYILPNKRTPFRIGLICSGTMHHGMYAPDTGLVEGTYEVSGMITGDVTLISFTRMAPVSIHKTRQHTVHRTTSGKAAAVLELPRLSVVRNGRRFDLMGRTDRDKHFDGLHRLNIIRNR